MASFEQVALHGQGGDELRALLACPAVGADERAGIVVVHEVFGLDAFTRSVLERFADAGYVALAPDLYSREGLAGPESSEREPAPQWAPDTIRSAVAGLPDRRAVADLDAAVEWLAEHPRVDPDRIVAIGFCMGGTLAFLLGCHSRRVAAIVDCYGRVRYAELSANKPNQPLELALNLSAPVLALFGDDDASIPAADVQAFETTLAQFGKWFEIERVPDAGHGFLNPFRGTWNEKAAHVSWERTFAFLTEALDLS